MDAGWDVPLLLPQKQCRGTSQPFAKHYNAGDLETGSNSSEGNPRKAISFPQAALKSLPSPGRGSSPSLHPAQPQTLPVSASSSPPGLLPQPYQPGAGTALPCPGAIRAHRPCCTGPTVLSHGDSGDKHFLLAIFCPTPAALSPARALLCPHRISHLHPERFTGPAQLPLLRHSAIPHPDEKLH